MAINLALTGEFGPESVESLQRKAREQLLRYFFCFMFVVL